MLNADFFVKIALFINLDVVNTFFCSQTYLLLLLKMCLCVNVFLPIYTVVFRAIITQMSLNT